jgi:uncharacterized protein YbcI
VSETELPANIRISRGMSALWKEHYGRGPSAVTTYVTRDVVLVVMRGGFNKVEETLLQAGRADAVDAQRAVFQDIMSERFRELIEAETGRKVEAYLSANHQSPDIMAETFVLLDEDAQPEGG